MVRTGIDSVSVTLLTEAVFLERYAYIAGTTNKVRKVEKINPPITAIPIETLLSDPAPSASAIGRIPRTVDKLVIRIGRSLDIEALMTASVLSRPVAFLWLANSTIRIPFFVTKPISIIIPI